MAATPCRTPRVCTSSGCENDLCVAGTDQGLRQCYAKYPGTCKLNSEGFCGLQSGTARAQAGSHACDSCGTDRSRPCRRHGDSVPSLSVTDRAAGILIPYPQEGVFHSFTRLTPSLGMSRTGLCAVKLSLSYLRGVSPQGAHFCRVRGAPC